MRKKNDCLILAEAKDLGLDVLLSYDSDILKRLASVEKEVVLIRPSDYWNSLGVPRGADLQTVPHNTNPLSQKTWWRW